MEKFVIAPLETLNKIDENLIHRLKNSRTQKNEMKYAKYQNKS